MMPASPARESDDVRLARFGAFIAQENSTAQGFSWYGIDGVDRVVEIHFADSIHSGRFNTVVTSRLFDPRADSMSASGVSTGSLSTDESRSRVRASLLDFAAQQLANERLRVRSEGAPVDLEAVRVEAIAERSRLEGTPLVDGAFALDGSSVPSQVQEVGEMHFHAALVHDAIVMLAGDAEFVKSKFATTVHSVQ